MSISFNDIRGDEVAYDNYGLQISQGKGYVAYGGNLKGKPTSFRPPGYPYLLGFIYYIFGHKIIYVKILQVILSSLLPILIYFLGKEVFSYDVGIISALISTFYFSYIWVPTILYSETVYTFFLTLSLIFYTRLWKYNFGDKKEVFCFGFLLGITTLIRSIFQLFPLLFFILLLWKRRQLKVSAKKIISTYFIFLFSFLLPILPYSVRNYVVHNSFVFISSGSGDSLKYSYFPKDGWRFGLVEEKYKHIGEEILNEVDRNNYKKKYVSSYILHHPKQILFKLVPLKFLYFWSPFNWEITKKISYNFTYVFILPFVFYGVIISFKENLDILVALSAPVIYTLFISLVFYGSARYRLPIASILIIISSLGIMRSYFRSKKLFNSFVPTFLFLNLILFYKVDSLKLFITKITNYLL